MPAPEYVAKKASLIGFHSFDNSFCVLSLFRPELEQSWRIFLPDDWWTKGMQIVVAAIDLVRA